MLLHTEYFIRKASLHAQSAGRLCHVQFNVGAHGRGTQDSSYGALPVVFVSSVMRGLHLHTRVCSVCGKLGRFAVDRNI